MSGVAITEKVQKKKREFTRFAGLSNDNRPRLRGRGAYVTRRRDPITLDRLARLPSIRERARYNERTNERFNVTHVN